MISIINKGGNPLGECLYEVRINEKIITTFKHNRVDGLTECLKKASVAVEKKKWEDAATILGIKSIEQSQG